MSTPEKAPAAAATSISAATDTSPRADGTPPVGSGPGAARRNVFGRLRKASDRVPTKWFAAIGTGLFLAVTAAFGGLNAVAEEVVEPPRLVAGDTHTSPQFAVTVERVVLIDDLSEAGVSAEEGTRALVVIATATNTWDQPQGTNGTDSLAELITIDGLDVAAPSGIARMDDQTYGPRLQPGVPAQLAIAWRVDAGAYHEGDEITVVLTDQTMFTGSTVLAGRYWDDPVVGATVTVVATDVGAGVDS